jgi:hypothetical protein
MASPNESTGSICIERANDEGYFRQTKWVTFLFKFFSWQIPKCKMTIVDDYIPGKTEYVIRRVEEIEMSPETEGSERPKYFSFLFRAEKMVDVAKEIIRAYEDTKNK